MTQFQILYPVFAMVTLTFYIAARMGFLRFAAIRRGDLNPSYFKLNQGAELPDYLAKYSNNYDNLLAAPILFYVLCGLLFVTEMVSEVQLILAWVFVASRIAHSYVHTTSNKIMVRARFFIGGLLLLSIMWVVFFFQVITR